jgi:FtsZ-interacting cell division protein ZipA
MFTLAQLASRLYCKEKNTTISITVGIVLYTAIYIYILFFKSEHLYIFNKFIVYVIGIDLVLSAFLLYRNEQKENVITNKMLCEANKFIKNKMDTLEVDSEYGDDDESQSEESDVSQSENSEGELENDFEEELQLTQQLESEEIIQQLQSEQSTQQLQSEQPIQQLQSEQPIQQLQSEELTQQLQSEQPIQQLQSEELNQQLQSEQPIQQLQSEELTQQLQSEQPTESALMHKNNQIDSEINELMMGSDTVKKRKGRKVKNTVDKL